MRKILVFGHTGQIARELRRHPTVNSVARGDVDLACPEACFANILTNNPSAVINAAAFTAVDRAEEAETLATTINGKAPAAMAKACAFLRIPLVHISTDYVFAGSGSNAWCTSDVTAPLNAYGRSKLVGENYVRASGAAYAILRTSWVFSAHGDNFVKAMLKLSNTRDRLDVVNNQIGGPTPASAIATACLSMANQLCDDPNKSGTYHFSGIPDVSWYEFASTIFSEAGRSTSLRGIPASAFPTSTVRPLNSRLNCDTTEAVFQIFRPSWKLGLRECLEDLGVLK